MAQNNDASSEKPSSGSKNFGKLLLPLFAAVNLAVVGGGAFLVWKSTLGWHSPVTREPAAFEELKKERKVGEPGESLLYTMPAFTVNLMGLPHRLIRVEMTFEMLDKEGFEEIVRNGPVVRDSIVRILNRKSFDEIETIQGKLFLKDQIAVTLNQGFKVGVVKDIYFNQFLVQ